MDRFYCMQLQWVLKYAKRIVAFSWSYFFRDVLQQKRNTNFFGLSFRVGDRCLPYRTVAMYSVRHAEESREINPAQSSVTR